MNISSQFSLYKAVDLTLLYLVLSLDNKVLKNEVYSMTKGEEWFRPLYLLRNEKHLHHNLFRRNTKPAPYKKA